MNSIFNLKFNDFSTLILSPCLSCGELGSNEYTDGLKKFRYNTIDRIDSNMGYTKDNTITLCKDCNKMKMDLSLEIIAKKGKLLSDLAKKLLNEKS